MTKATDAQIAKALAATAGNMAAAAKKLGLNRSSVKRRVDASTDLQLVCSEAKETTTDIAESALVISIRKREPWAVRFWLRTQAKERGYTYREELSGPGGTPVPVQATAPRGLIEALSKIDGATRGLDDDA